MPVEDAVIVKRLKALLAEVDMATTTERKLRQTLEAELGEDLSGRKPLIRQEVQAYLEGQHVGEVEDGQEQAAGDGLEDGTENGAVEEPADEEEEEHVAAKPKKKRRASAFGSILSEPMQEFLGQESMPRTEVVKRLWAYIKEHELQDPKNRRKIRPDAALLKLFKPPLDMFKMNKQLSRHVFAGDPHAAAEEEGADEEDEVEISEEDEDEEEEEEEEQTPAKKRTKAAGKAGGGGGAQATKGRQRGRAEKGDAKPAKRRRSAGMGGGCELSPEMRAFLGVPRMPRPQVVKAVWDYVKAHGLQDPKDKRSLLPDAKLATILTPPVNMFSMNRQLSKHVFSGGQP